MTKTQIAEYYRFLNSPFLYRTYWFTRETLKVVLLPHIGVRLYRLDSYQRFHLSQLP